MRFLLSRKAFLPFYIEADTNRVFLFQELKIFQIFYA